MVNKTNAAVNVTDAAVNAAVANGATNAAELAAVLKISTSNAYYRLRVLKQRQPQTLRTSQPAAPAADVANVAAVNAAIDITALIPKVDLNYKTRAAVDDVIKALATVGANVCLVGEAGSGKTSAAQQLAASKGLPFLRVACDDAAILRDFIGTREIINGATVWRSGLLTALLQQPAVVLFDEFNALPAARLFFLHELLDQRRFFVKEANAIYNVNNDAIIILACNPNSAKYSGTNKTNAALIDRCAVVDVKPFDADELAANFEAGSQPLTDALKRYYGDANELIKAQQLRVVFGIRAVKRIATLLKNGFCLADALAVGFYNCALLTAGTQEKNALIQLAKVVFGIDAVNAEVKTND